MLRERAEPELLLKKVESLKLRLDLDPLKDLTVWKDSTTSRISGE